MFPAHSYSKVTGSYFGYCIGSNLENGLFKRKKGDLKSDKISKSNLGFDLDQIVSMLLILF